MSVRKEQILNFNAGVIASVLTSYTSSAGTVSSSDSILQAIQKLNGNVGNIVSGVNMVFGRTGNVTASANDYTFDQLASKPTTISGYGITDAAPITGSNNYIQIQTGSAQTGSFWIYGNELVEGKISIIGINGSGSISLISQSISPSPPPSGTQIIFTSSTGSFTIMGSNGYAASFSKSLLTSSQVYYFPPVGGVFALANGTAAQYITGTGSYVTFPTNVSSFSNDSGYLTNTTGDVRYIQISGSTIVGAISPNADNAITLGTTTNRYSILWSVQTRMNQLRFSSTNLSYQTTAGTTIATVFNSNGNFLFQSGSTQTDLGYYISVNSSGTNGYFKAGNFSVDSSSVPTFALASKIAVTEGTGGRVGQVVLVAGTKAITITGLTTSSRAFPGFVTQGGTSTGVFQYQMVCTANTLTITAVTVAGVAVTTDTSTVNYFVLN